MSTDSSRSPTDNESSDESLVLDFIELLESDRSAGQVHPLRYYLERFPEAELAVALEYLHRESLTGPTASVAAVPKGQFGPFVLTGQLGRGGQGVVWRALDLRLGRPVALKILTLLGAVSDRARARFLREAKVASRFEHPGIATVYEVGEEEGIPWISMQLVEGVTLAAQIAESRGQKLTRQHYSRTLDQYVALADAIHAAHEAGIIHRDLKPGNIMIRPDGTPVVLDFGCASDLREEVALTATRDQPGTPAYMAPELLDDSGQRADRQSDVFALGVSLYETLFHRRPFEAATPALLLEAVRKSPIVLPKSARFRRRDLRVVLETALERNRGRRYATMVAMAEDLPSGAGGRPGAARPTPAWLRIGRTLRPPPRAAAATMLLLIATAVAPMALNLQRDARAARLAREEAGIESVFAGFPLRTSSSDEQLRDLERVLKLRPESAEATALYALALFRRNQIRKAEEFLEARSKVVEAEPQLRLILAQFARSQGDSDRALRLESATPEPTTSVGYYVLGISKVIRGMSPWEEARNSILLAPGPRIALAQLWASGLSADSDVEDCQEFSRYVLHHWPNDPRAMALAAIAKQRFAKDDVPALTAEAYEKAPDDLLALRSHASTLSNHGRLDESIAILQERIARHPEEFDTRLYLFKTLNRRGRSQAAIELLNEYDRITGDKVGDKVRVLDAFVNALLSSTQRDSRLFEAPIRDLADRLESVETARPLANAVHLLLAARGEDTREVARRVGLVADPDTLHIQSASRIGRILYYSNQMELAADYLESALARDDAVFRELAQELIQSQAGLGRLDRAESLCEKALASDIRSSGISMCRGMCFENKEMWAEALAAYEEGKKFQPPNFYNFLGAGLMLERLDRRAEAIEALRRTVRRFGGAPLAKFHLGSLLLTDGRPEEALPFLEEAHRVAQTRPGWNLPSAARLEEARRQLSAQKSEPPP